MANTPRDIDDLINGSYDKFLKKIGITEEELFKYLSDILDKFSTAGGKLVTDATNYETVNTISRAIEEAIKKSGYPKVIDDFIPIIDSIEHQVKESVTFLNKGINFKKGVADVSQDKKLAIEGLVTALNSPASIRVNLEAPIKQIINSSIQNNANLKDARAQLKAYIQGDAERGGRLSQYYKQIATDSLNQWAGTVSGRIASEYEIADVIYTGGLIKTSRPQCIRYTQQLSGKLTKEIIEYEMRQAQKTVGKRTASFAGYSSYAYPTAENFYRVRGGHQCRHYVRPYAMTVDEAENAIALYNSNFGTLIKAKYHNLRYGTKSENLKQAKKQADNAPAKVNIVSTEGATVSSTKAPGKNNFSNVSTTSIDQANEYAEQWAETLNDQQRETIKSWTDGDHVYFNAALRRREGFEKYFNKASLLKDIEILSETLKTAPKFEGRTVRNMGWTDEAKYNKFLTGIKKGGIFVDKGFAASSFNDLTNFKSSNTVQFKINGKTGALINKISTIAGEDEVLFNKGTPFRVDNIEVVNENLTIIELTEILRA